MKVLLVVLLYLSGPVLADQSDSGHSDLTRFVEIHEPGVSDPAYVAWMRIALVAGKPQIKEVFTISPMYKDNISKAIITRSLPRESNVSFDSQGDVSADGSWLGVWTLSFYAKATGFISMPLEEDPKVDYDIAVAVALRRTLETFLRAPLPLTPISGIQSSDTEPWEVKVEMSDQNLALASVVGLERAVGGYGNVTTKDSSERYAYQLWDNTERKFFGMVASGYPDYRGSTLETEIFADHLHDPKLSYHRRLTKSSQLEVWQAKDHADRIRYIIYDKSDDIEFFRVKYVCDGQTWEKTFVDNETHFVRSDNLKILTVRQHPGGLLPLTHEGEQLIQKYPGPQDWLEIWRLTDEPNELRMYNQIDQAVRVWYMVDGKRRDSLLGSKALSTSVEDIHGHTIKILNLERFNVTK